MINMRLEAISVAVQRHRQNRTVEPPMVQESACPLLYVLHQESHWEDPTRLHVVV